MADDLRLEIRSDPRLLEAVRALVRAYLSGFGFSGDRCDEIVLAVDEACTNAIRHAYGGRTDQTIDLAMQSDADWITLELRDTGRPAPAARVRRRDVPPPDTKRLKPGGLGVQLIYRVFDEATFSPGRQQGNCVRMRLKRPVREAQG